MRPQPAGVGQQHHPATGGSSRGPGRLPPDDRPPWQAPPYCPATHRLHQPLTRALSPLQTRRNASGAPSQATRKVRLAVPDCRRRSQTHLPELQLCPPHEWLPCSCPVPGFADQTCIMLAGVLLNGAGDLHGGDRPAATKANWRRHGRRRAAAHQPGRGHDGCVLEWPPRLGVVQAAAELLGVADLPVTLSQPSSAVQPGWAAVVPRRAQPPGWPDILWLGQGSSTKLARKAL
jgi:hypothetical protein